MALLSPLTPDERTTFVVVALSQKSLVKLVGRLEAAPAGTRLDTLSPWELGWMLVDLYDQDAEVAKGLDKALRRELGDSPLAPAVAEGDGAQAVTDLLLRSADPARDLAWALLSAGHGTGELAAAAVQTIIAEFDEADARGEEEESVQGEASPPAPSAEDVVSDIAKEAARARSQRERALKRIGGLKQRLAELEKGLGAARRDLRVAGETRAVLETERDRLVDDARALRARLQSGTAAEVARVTEELEAEKRRGRALEGELEEARESAAGLQARVRTLEGERTRPAAAASADEEERRSGAAWSLPVFTDEFYESIRRWDRRVVRNAFEKVSRLAEDWRHPSLRAIGLEGLPGLYRIRVATDVRLIYRPLEGGRLEILSLIDREDLDRYIRQAKSR